MGRLVDIGNTTNQGQVILGGHGLPTFFDVYPELRKKKDRKNEPSRSMAESLARQDLFINSTLATLGGQLMWQLMRHGGINHHGYIVNLHEGLVLPERHSIWLHGRETVLRYLAYAPGSSKVTEGYIHR